MAKITLISCNQLEGFIHDEDLLVDALTELGHQAELKPWETLEDNGEDLFVVRTTWNYFDHLSDFLTKLQPIADRLWNPLPLIQWNSHKGYLVELLNKGLPVLPLQIVNSPTELAKAIEELPGDDFIVKPAVGAGAKGLIRFDRNTLPEIQKESIVQKFYPEILEGEVSLFYYQGEFGYAIRKTPKPGDIRVQEEFGSELTLYQPTEQDLDTAKAIVKAIPNEWLYARVDLIPGLGLIELELIEPSMYLRMHPEAPKMMAQAIDSA